MKRFRSQGEQHFRGADGKRRHTAIAIGALALCSPILVSVLSFQSTSAAYVDSSTSGLGTAGKVGSNTFQIEVQNSNKSWQTSTDPAQPLVVKASVASVGSYSDSPSATTELKFRVAAESPSGSIAPTLTAASTCTDECQSVLPYLRFSLFYDDAAVTLSRLSIDEFNSKPLRQMSGLVAGVEHRLTIGVELLPDTPFRYNATKINFDVRLDAATTPIS